MKITNNNLIVPLDNPIYISLEKNLQSHIVSLLYEIDVNFVESQDIFAYASRNDIYFSKGLLNLIDFSLNIAILAREMESGNFQLIDQYNGEHSAFTPAIMCTVGYHYFKIPFPDLSPIFINNNNNKEIKIKMLETSILAFLCHELGHINLGHTAEGNIHKELTSPFEYVPEDINLSKYEEYEADLFMLNSFLIKYKGITELVFVLNILGILELVRKDEKRRHPLLINRIANLTSLVEDNAEALSEFASYIYKTGIENIEIIKKLLRDYDAEPFELFAFDFQQAINQVYLESAKK